MAARALGWWPVVALAAWPALVAPGFVIVERYAGAPGRLAEAPPTWPDLAEIDRPTGMAAIVMLAHPRCPCTRSSLRELSLLMAEVDGKAEGFVLFFDPSGARWEKSDLWDLAAGIPGMHVVADVDGETARSFGAYTSGQVVVYDADGKLVFNGGITRARGHDGANIGRSSIVELLSGQTPEAVTSNVFGCDLREPERAP